MKKFLLKNKKIVCGVIGVIVLVAICSGVVFLLVKNHYNKADELANLQATFSQQIGTDGITIKQMLRADKVYTAVWESSDGKAHVSWNVSGLWATVWNEPTTTP